MTRVACLMMQRDETLLLRPWLLYHGYLFGFENLYVYDNGSRWASVLATLREFQDLGVHVDTAHSSPRDFEFKGEVLGAKIREFAAGARYDVALPLDCDEFLAINGPNGVTCARTDILEELKRIHAHGVACRTTHCLDNRPGHLDLFRHMPHVKSVVVVPAFDGIDHGFHEATLPPGAEYGRTALMHIHLHFKPFHHVLTGARNKLAPYVDVDDARALKEFAGVGNHLTRYFRMSAEEYYHDLGGYTHALVRFRGLQRLIALFADGDEFLDAWQEGHPTRAADLPPVIDLEETRFIASAYLDANPDLDPQRISALNHFLAAGYLEGRRLEASPAGEREVVERLARIRAERHDGVAGYAGVALALSRVGLAQEADALLRDAIREFSNTEVLLREHALLAMFESRNAEAATRWDLLRSLFPDNPEGYQYGATAHRRAGQLDVADEIIHAGLGRFPNHLGIAIEQGDIAVDRGNWMRAKALWDSLLRLHPDDASLRARAESAAVELAAWRERNARLERVGAGVMSLQID